jgi:hypothetical protein
MTNLSSSVNREVNLSCHLNGRRAPVPVRQTKWSVSGSGGPRRSVCGDHAASQPRARAALKRSSALPDFPTFSNQRGKRQRRPGPSLPILCCRRRLVRTTIAAQNFPFGAVIGARGISVVTVATIAPDSSQIASSAASRSACVAGSRWFWSRVTTALVRCPVTGFLARCGGSELGGLF